MHEIVVPVLYVLSGICAYASLTHLGAGLRDPRDSTQIVFGCLCLLILPMAFSHILTVQAQDVASYVSALRWNLASLILSFALLPWFIALYVGKRPLPFLAGLSLLYSLLFAVNLISPYSLQYDHISRLMAVRMPWGEMLARVQGHSGRWPHITATAAVAGFAYMLYALAGFYRQDRSRSNLGMLIAISLLLVNVLYGIFARLFSVNSVAFGPIGFFAVIIVMSRILTIKSQQKKKEVEQLIWHQANFDPLTKMPNRQMFQDRMFQEIKKSHRANLPLALLFLDLDRFKEVNDTLGHDMGDKLLKETAQRLTSCVRETDTVARFGGDEFIIILGELDDPSNVDRVTQDILSKLTAPFQLGSEIVYISASIGITLYPEDAITVEALLKNADQAMYAAKNQGRNGYHYFTHSMQHAAQTRLRLMKDLREALAAEEFRVYYQPIVDLETGYIRKAEALIRWEHPKRGLIGPVDFIPLAEETGLIVGIGEWVFRQAAQQAGLWRKSHHAEFQISVNKSPVQFHNEDKAYPSWTIHLGSLNLPGQCIVVEITEGLLLDTGTRVTERLQEFRDAGIQVSLDDFGTGYSSLSYLNKFDIDYLKIDQSFVRNLAPASSNMALCEAIIVMAHKLGMKVIAEGIETEQQRELLTAAGCDYGQGYLFSKPIPAEQFEEIYINQEAHGQALLHFGS